MEHLYRERQAVPLQTFTTRHSNRKVSIVMASSTTFTQCSPETTTLGKITQNKSHFVVQGHSRSPIWVYGNRTLIYDFLSGTRPDKNIWGSTFSLSPSHSSPYLSSHSLPLHSLSLFISLRRT